MSGPQLLCHYVHQWFIKMPILGVKEAMSAKYVQPFSTFYLLVGKAQSYT